MQRRFLESSLPASRFPRRPFRGGVSQGGCGCGCASAVVVLFSMAGLRASPEMQDVGGMVGRAPRRPLGQPAINQPPAGVLLAPRSSTSLHPLPYIADVAWRPRGAHPSARHGRRVATRDDGLHHLGLSPLIALLLICCHSALIAPSPSLDGCVHDCRRHGKSNGKHHCMFGTYPLDLQLLLWRYPADMAPPGLAAHTITRF